MRRHLLITSLVTSLLIALVGAGCSSNQTIGVPSGESCSENVAYLQSGVDRYYKAFGSYPSQVNQLLDTRNGKGPFVEVVPQCPSGNVYVIQNGKVGESPR